MNTLKTHTLLASVITIMFFVVPIEVRNASASINTQLDLGDNSNEVTKLQTYLASDTNIYPSKLVTGYFGQLTKAGVERFQTVNGIISYGNPITTGYGRVGPITRASINLKLNNATGSTQDVHAPIISRVNITTGNTTAQVNWTTNESAYGKMYYSTQPISIRNTFDITGEKSGEPLVVGNLAQYDINPQTSHIANLTGLQPNTRYYYLLVVYDESKNVSLTTPNSFRTK